MAAKTPQYSHSFRYPINTLGLDEQVLTKFPNLAVHEKLVQYGFGENDWALRYAIYMGFGSGLHVAIPDWTDRKAEALRLAGITPKHPRYAAAIEGTDEGVEELRWTWLEKFSPRKMMILHALQDSLTQDCRKVSTQLIKTDDLQGEALLREHKLRAEVGQTFKLREADITAIEKELFMDDDELKRINAERYKPLAEAGSIEQAILRSKGQ